MHDGKLPATVSNSGRRHPALNCNVDFFSIILFLGLYYVRPHEWIAGADQIPLNSIAIGLAIWSLFSRRRGLGWKEFFHTPHDTLMALFFFWILWTSYYDVSTTFTYIYPLFIFYWVTVLTLKDIPRLLQFLHWWTFFIVFVAALAVASEYGIDPTGSYDLTHGSMKGRLALNLSIFKNPNALGHSIVPAVAMLYFVGFWKRPIFSKVFAPVVMAIPIWCIFLTSSKGAFISCFATIVSSFSFKRPITIQITIFVLSGTMGWAAMQALPRMSEISSSKTDEAIQGRVDAFKFGLEMMRTRTYGIGYARFAIEFERRYHYFKSAHSSYVYVGCEFGKIGLLLFLGIIYFAFRTLFSVKTTTDEEERVRRLLFVLLLSFVVSSWMIGWYNRATYWLIAAACAAFHRIMLEKEQDQIAAEAAANPLPEVDTSPRPALAYASPRTAVTTINSAITVNDIKLTTAAVTTPPSTTDDETPKKPARLWNRIRWYDLVAIYFIFLLTVEIWRYMIKHM